MESFIVSILVFIVMVGGLGVWQHRTRRSIKEENSHVEHQIEAAAEVAQRRHVRRFGRASTDLDATIKRALHHAAPRESAHRLKS
jgi:hypothetical protein